ncbi:MAG: hypothetical protein M0R80_02075 [Proteobacteria bacterium]|jgi:hypothetical protein|nr:hypothetical protein [Pseudomonadota bacterium]
MKYTINQVATCGCEILNEKREVFAWAVDRISAEIIAKALEIYAKTQEEK